MTTRKPYESDLTDAQWQHIAPKLPPERPPGSAGRPREHSYREIVNAILYIARTACQWRQLPHDFPPYTTVSDYYHQWRKSGLLQDLHDSLRAEVRKQAGREAEPSVLLIDSQSVKTTEKGGRRNPKKLSALTQASRLKAANAISR
jgi:putative transposase